MSRLRVLLYAALCLCVPLPAFALTSESEPPAELSVTATLDGCGLAEAQILCRIDVAFDEVPNATRYTASVTRPDGSVVDHGAVGAGSATVWVPYVGNGTYLVEISAYGKPEEPGDEEELLGSEEATAEPERETDGEGASDKAKAEEDDSAPEKAKDGKDADAKPSEPCKPLDAEADATDREELAELEARAGALWEKAATVKDKDEAKALEKKLLALSGEIEELEGQIEARVAAACPDPEGD